VGADVIKIEARHLPDMLRVEGSDPKRDAEKAEQLMIAKRI